MSRCRASDVGRRTSDVEGGLRRVDCGLSVADCRLRRFESGDRASCAVRACDVGGSARRLVMGPVRPARGGDRADSAVEQSATDDADGQTSPVCARARGGIQVRLCARCARGRLPSRPCRSRCKHRWGTRFRPCAPGTLPSAPTLNGAHPRCRATRRRDEECIGGSRCVGGCGIRERVRRSGANGQAAEEQEQRVRASGWTHAARSVQSVDRTVGRLREPWPWPRH